MLTKEELLKKILKQALTPEYLEELSKNLEKASIKEEQFRLEQQRWWDKHKHDTYNI